VSSTTHVLTIKSANPTISYDYEGKEKYKKRNIKGSEFSTELHLKNIRFAITMFLLCTQLNEID